MQHCCTKPHGSGLGPLYVWPDVWSADLHLCIKNMVIHDIECPYWNQMSLNNTNQPTNQPFTSSTVFYFIFLYLFIFLFFLNSFSFCFSSFLYSSIIGNMQHCCTKRHGSGLGTTPMYLMARDLAPLPCTSWLGTWHHSPSVVFHSS